MLRAQVRERLSVVVLLARREDVNAPGGIWCRSTHGAAGRAIVGGVALVAADDQRMPQLDYPAPEQIRGGMEPRPILERPLVRLSPTAHDRDTHGDPANLEHLTLDLPRNARSRA